MGAYKGDDGRWSHKVTRAAKTRPLQEYDRACGELDRIEREQRMEDLREAIKQTRQPKTDEKQLILASRGHITRAVKELGI
jgi:hypothetical protein